MQKLLLFVLLFMASNAWALEGAVNPDSDNAFLPLTAGASQWNCVGTKAMKVPLEVAQAITPDDENPVNTSDDSNDTNSTPTSSPTPMPMPPNLSVVTTPVANNPAQEGNFVFQLDGGVVPAISSAAATVFNSNFGLDARISYAFDDVFSIGLETGFYDLGVDVKNTTLPSGSSANLSHIPALITMQFYFGDAGGPVQPYLTLAGGLAFDSYNLQGASFASGVTTNWVNLELDPMVGVAFPIDHSLKLFVQGQWDMDFGPNNSGNGAESADSPIMLLPIQAGLSFNL